MSQPLISVGSLLRESWKDARKHMKSTVKLTVWMWAILSALMVVFYYFLPTQYDSMTAGYVHPGAGLSIWAIVLLIAVIIPVAWLGIRLVRLILALDKNQTLPSTEAKEAWNFFLPLLWIGIMMYVLVLIGSILLIIPGIWLAISLCFSAYFLLEDNLHGKAALKASRALVRGRWWATFWRLLATGIVYGIAFAIVIGILSWILRAIYIPAIIIMVAMYALTYLFMVPIQMFVSAKLFHSLKANPVTSAPVQATVTAPTPPPAAPVVPPPPAAPTM